MIVTDFNGIWVTSGSSGLGVLIGKGCSNCVHGGLGVDQSAFLWWRWRCWPCEWEPGGTLERFAIGWHINTNQQSWPRLAAW